jgi:hypothetical protein
LVGLFGQAAAYAAGPQVMIASMAASQMDADCMAMMQKEQAPEQQPCQGLTLDCIAAMGCVVPIVLKEPAGPMAAPQFVRTQAFWTAPAILIGSDVAPEPDPPTLLA